MNILYIIGNGLDIAHHMNTSYQDFFRYYLNLPSADSDIQAMKKDIDSHRYETWADLEMGMGGYSSQCPNKGVFLKCLADIKSSLKIYLEKESEKIKNFTLKSYSDFLNPGYFLEPEPRNLYEFFRNRMKPGLLINVMTFNYTSTLEWLFDYKGSMKLITDSTRIESIQHVHGMLDDMMVMGVNDSSQISNNSFNTDEDVIEDFVKPEYNDACMNNKNTICESLINRADVIVFYGTSLGLSDVKWWRLIGQRVSNDNYPLLIYLPYDETKNQAAQPNHLRRWVKQSISEIKDKFDIQLDDNILASRVCVAYNKRLFNIVKVSQRHDVKR